jgi:uncharacterized protein
MKYFILLLAVILTLPKISSAQKIELINSGELIKTGVIAHDSGQYKKALSVYNKISRNDTNYVRSLYERAVTCEADSQFKQAIKYSEEAISLPEQRDYLPDLYNVYGNALHADGQPEKALTVFDLAIAKYPSYSLLYFNKGVVQLTSKKYTEAEALFQKALMINPYMYSAHYQLGLAALYQGKIIPAYLSFIGYLLVNPTGRYSSNAINILSQLSKGTDEILGYKNARTVNPDDNYQAVEEIMLSKIALDKGYKPIIALDDQISRQIQAIFEKLEYTDGNTDFYIQYYFPYYKNVFAGGKFELFINHIFSSAKVSMIQDFDKKNKKPLEVFVNEAAGYFNTIRATRELFYKKRDGVNDRYYFEDGKVVGKGVLTNNGKTLTGHWEFYYPAGNMKGVGEYDDLGKRQGEWTFYFISGKLKAKEHYKDGSLEGEAGNYFSNCNLSSHESYIDGKLQGLCTYYYYAGHKKSETNYKLGKKDGEERNYYSNGNLHTVAKYAADLLTGTSNEYFKSGGLKETQVYVNGKGEGEFKLYHEQGGLSVIGQNANDKGYGEWKYYYENGKLKEKRNYVNDDEDGLHEEYFDSGQLSGAYTVKKGKINGEAIYFYKDGKTLSKYVYNNGVIRSVKYFDKTGAQIYASELKNNLINIITYDTGGLKKSSYSADQKGDMTGADTLFYPSGKINQVAQYSKGELNGPLITYYLNGRKKAEVNYTTGKENGYSTTYYTNGKMELEGWVIDGDDQGEWNYYDEKGRLSVKTYYLDNDLNGYKEEYLPNGRKNIEQKYQGGWLEKLIQYDTAGKVLTIDTFPKATGKFVLYYPNRKVMTECDYVKGDFDGFYKTYFFDGSLSTSTFYKRGIKDSTYLSLYYGGIKDTEGSYKAGSKTGIWKDYNEDGKLSATTTYVSDQKNGLYTRFYREGTKSQVSNYKDDDLDGSYIKYSIDGTLVCQIGFEEGRATAYTYQDKDGRYVTPQSVAPLNALLKAYFPNGKIARECAYSDGVKTGRDVTYYPSGQVWSVDTTEFNISEGNYKEYFPDGKLKYDYPYAADNVDGICREYNTNGALIKEEPYDNGEYNGPVKYFDANGKLIKTMWYVFGTLTAVKNE